MWGGLRQSTARFTCNRELGGEEAECVAESLPPRQFIMRAAFHFYDFELAVVPPAFGAEEGGEVEVVGVVAFVEAVSAVVEVHTDAGGQGVHGLKGEELAGMGWRALGDIFKGGGEAEEAGENAGVVQGEVEGEKAAEGGAAEDAGARIGESAVAGVEVGDEFRGDELGIGGATPLGGKIVVAQRDIAVREAVGMADADDDGLGQDAFGGEKGDPFVGGPIDAAESAGGGIEDIRAIVEDDDGKAPEGLAGVARGEPDEDFAGVGEGAGGDALAGKAAAEAVLPVGDGVADGVIEPDFADGIGGDIAVGVDGLGFPGAAGDLVLEMRAEVGLDLADVKRGLPAKGNRLGRLPVAKGRKAAGDENRLVRPLNGRNNLKTDFAHGTERT